MPKLSTDIDMHPKPLKKKKLSLLKGKSGFNFDFKGFDKLPKLQLKPM